MGLSAGLCPLPASYPYREVGNLKVRHSRWQIVSRETQREQSELGERSGWSVSPGVDSASAIIWSASICVLALYGTAKQ